MSLRIHRVHTDILHPNSPIGELPMMLRKGTTVAVAVGERLNLFRNSGDEAGLKLTPAELTSHSIADVETAILAT